MKNVKWKTRGKFGKGGAVYSTTERYGGWTECEKVRKTGNFKVRISCRGKGGVGC